jgi:hypothetical protein
VEEAASRFDLEEWKASPVMNLCDFEVEKAHLLEYADVRDPAVVDQTACQGRKCGLKGEYFRGTPTEQPFDPVNRAFTRVDRVIGFDWRSGGPELEGLQPVFPEDQFQVRWTGTVTAPTTGLYTFYTRSDDGARLWLSGLLAIDDWVSHPVQENQVTVLLVGGIPVDLRLDYFEGGVDAAISLSWAGPNIPKQLVPGRYLRPAP